MGVSAVDVQCLSGDEGGFVGGEVSDGVGDILGYAPAFEGDGGEVGVFAFLRVIFVSFDGDPAGSDAVDGNAEGG